MESLARRSRVRGGGPASTRWAASRGVVAMTTFFALTAATSSGCLTDTSQTDFQAGMASNLDLTTSSGDVLLASSGGTPTLDQQNTTVSNSGNAITTTTWEAQTFIPGTSGQLSQIDADLFCSACSGTDQPITVDIRSTSGGAPTSTILATTTIPGFSSGSGQFYSATFSTPATVAAGNSRSGTYWKGWSNCEKTDRIARPRCCDGRYDTRLRLGGHHEENEHVRHQQY